MARINILSIDDAAFIRDLIKRTLRGFFPDLGLDEAINGKKAQNLIAKNAYDLILCDWEMPEMNGLQLLTWLREYETRDNLQKTPFIMVTSRGDKENVVQAVEAGVSDYIGKPFSNDQLLKKVLKALSRNHKDYVQELLNGGGKSAAAPQNSGPKGLFKDSAQNLLGAASITPPKPSTGNDSASVLAGHSATEKLVRKQSVVKARTRSGNKGAAQLRVAHNSVAAIIRDINLVEILLQIPRAELVPIVFDQAVVDIQLPDQSEEVARMNCFIVSVSAMEKDMSCDQLLVSLKYVDDDPNKLGFLSKYIAAVR
ncbi:response regulator [Gynuella sunshinyii]|uniref:Response regulator containing CheY-like receiver, AAA-type ATPase, and DNA-binding domain n=1 Tax=Gynuella sunshinyii YC6258 TaxID=1445510 RepID=A0A0C5V063_9GAMM|nr:response regulator [Gynuella sunshinyii]AJQ92960.1 response regulator containing CheY-like receiver, AAA-type ATPase, and DNA-binding domain [Gynuella sunshinyii YC6258]